MGIQIDDAREGCKSLLDLVARCEAATGPSRELDADIAVAIQAGCRKGLLDDLEYLAPIRKDDNEALAREGGAYWFHCRSGKSMRRADDYTASLDAALALVPEGLFWRVESGSLSPFSYAMISTRNDYFAPHIGLSATPALSLCAAALRSRANSP